jgi:hypothetical protein
MTISIAARVLEAASFLMSTSDHSEVFSGLIRRRLAGMLVLLSSDTT